MINNDKMASWVPVDYVVTGCREELDDMREKLLESERHENKHGDAGVMHYEGDPLCVLDNAHFFGMFGIKKRAKTLGTYYIEKLESKEETPFPIEVTEDGTLYFKWTFGHRGCDTAKLRQVIEGYYKSVKIYYIDPYCNTNDTEHRFFAHRFPLLIDGLHYFLHHDNNTARLNCDDLWTDEVMQVPEAVVYGGQEYKVTGIIDFQFYQPFYGSCSGSGGGTRPTRLRQLQLPATLRYVKDGACARIKTLLKVNIPDGCSVGRDAFADCGIEELTLGENTRLDMDCFRGTRVQSVDLPKSTAWTEYGDFGGYGICGHFVFEEQSEDICPIIFDVFGDTPWESRVLSEWKRLRQQKWEEEKNARATQTPVSTDIDDDDLPF